MQSRVRVLALTVPRSCGTRPETVFAVYLCLLDGLLKFSTPTLRHASYIHEAAVQAVAAHRACWVAATVDGIQSGVQTAARQHGLDDVIERADFRGRELLSNIGLTEGPDFEDSLTSFVAGVTAIASEELEI